MWSTTSVGIRIFGRSRVRSRPINARGAAFLARLAGADRADRAPHWRAIGLDPDGLDIAAGARAARINFEAPSQSPEAWRETLAAYFRKRAG